MAAPSEERKQQQVEEEAQAARYRQPPPCGTACAVPERPPDGGQVCRRRGRGGRGERSRSAAALSLRSLRLCRRLLSSLLQWFAARPLGQRALEGVGHTLAAAERAVTWAGGATATYPVPLAWFFMMPIVMALLVVRTGADLAERYLDIELPDNRQLVRWLEWQRTELEQFQAVAAQKIRTQTVHKQDPSLGFLNTWPFNIPYRVAQQLGVVPVQVDTLTPPPDSAGDKSLYFSPEAHKTSKEQAESEAQQDNTQEEAEGEKAQEGKLTPPPESVGDKSQCFSPEAHKTAKEQAESEAQQDNTKKEAEGEKAQEEKIKEEAVAVDVAEEARVMLPLHDQPRNYVPANQPSALGEDIATLCYTGSQKTDGGRALSYREWMQLRRDEEDECLRELLGMRQSPEAIRSRDTPQEGQSLEPGLSRDVGERQQTTPSQRRYKRSYWDNIFR